MILERKTFGTIVGAFGIVLLMGILLAVPALAQEGTAGETTAPTTPESTVPGPGQGCENPQVVETFSGTENELTDPLEITGDSFRLTYETEVTSNGAPELEVDVLDETGELIGQGFLAFDGEDGNENILAGPGNFILDIRANRVSYTITVQDCIDDDNADDDNTNDDNADDDNANDDDVVNVPDKDLPNTGGVPLLGIAFFVLAGAGLLTSVVRRRD